MLFWTFIALTAGMAAWVGYQRLLAAIDDWPAPPHEVDRNSQFE